MKRGKKILLVAVLLCLCLIVYHNVTGERKRIRKPEDTDSEFYLEFGEEDAEQIDTITLTKYDIETYETEEEIEITDQDVIREISIQILALEIREDENTDSKWIRNNRVKISFNNGVLPKTLYIGPENRLVSDRVSYRTDTKVVIEHERYITEPAIDFEQWWKLAALDSSEPTIAYINDESVQWDDIKYAEVYVGGCALPPAFTVEDSETINELVESITEIREYKSIPKGTYLEGLCNIWIKFSNGVCIGTYEDVNQGYVDLELRATGGPFYELPKEFRERVLELISEN